MVKDLLGDLRKEAHPANEWGQNNADLGVRNRGTAVEHEHPDDRSMSPYQSQQRRIIPPLQVEGKCIEYLRLRIGDTPVILRNGDTPA